MLGCSERRASWTSDAIAAPGGVKSSPRHGKGKGPQGLNSVLCVRRPVSCLPRPPLPRLLSRVLARACLGGHAQHSAVIRMALPPLSGDGTLALWRAHCETGIGVMPPIPYLNLFFCGTCWGSIHSIAQDGCEPCLCLARACLCVYTCRRPRRSIQRRPPRRWWWGRCPRRRASRSVRIGEKSLAVAGRSQTRFGSGDGCQCWLRQRFRVSS